MTDQQAAALVAAGRILQARGRPGGPIKIAPAPGETYPQAVARVVATLDDGDRERLRELVAWVLEYDRYTATAGTSESGKKFYIPIDNAP